MTALTLTETALSTLFTLVRFLYMYLEDSKANELLSVSPELSDQKTTSAVDYQKQCYE